MTHIDRFGPTAAQRHIELDNRPDTGATRGNRRQIRTDDDTALQIWNDGRSRGERGLGARSFQFRDHTAFEPLAENPQAFRERIGCAGGNFVFLIQFQELEIGLCHFTDERKHHTPPRFLAGQKLRAGRLVQTANLDTTTGTQPSGCRGVSIAQCCSVNAAFLFAEPRMLVVVSRCAPPPIPKESSVPNPNSPMGRKRNSFGALDLELGAWSLPIAVNPGSAR